MTRSRRIELKCDWIEIKLNLLLERTAAMALDLTKLNAGIAAIEAARTADKQKIADLTAQVATLQAQIGEGPADQAAVDAAGDKLTADAAS